MKSQNFIFSNLSRAWSSTTGYFLSSSIDDIRFRSSSAGLSSSACICLFLRSCSCRPMHNHTSHHTSHNHTLHHTSHITHRITHHTLQIASPITHRVSGGQDLVVVCTHDQMSGRGTRHMMTSLTMRDNYGIMHIAARVLCQCWWYGRQSCSIWSDSNIFLHFNTCAITPHTLPLIIKWHLRANPCVSI